jgi:hypothetical protein
MTTRPPVLGAVLVLAACGGGQSKTYTAGATQHCLAGAGLSVDLSGWDYISHTARGGSYRVNTPSDSVVLAFNGTSSDAERMVASYKMLGSGAGVPTNDIISKKGDVAIAWDSTPTSAERTAVEGCLR